MKNESMYQNIKNLSIEGSLIVTIKKSDDNAVNVFIEEGEIEVKQQGDRLSIQSLSSNVTQSVSMIGNNFSNVVIGGNISIGNVSMINGRTFIDGQQVIQNIKTKPVPSICISIPDGLNLEMDLDGCGSFKSAVAFIKANVDLSGVSNATFTAFAAVVETSGTSKATVSIDGGFFQAVLSGCSQVKANGSFSEIQSTVSGTSSLRSQGVVSGDFTAKASGCASINHIGNISGRIREKTSGLGKVNI